MAVWHSWLDCAPGGGNYVQTKESRCQRSEIGGQGSGNWEGAPGSREYRGAENQGNRAEFNTKPRGIGILNLKIGGKTHGEFMHLRPNGTDDITRVVIFVRRGGWRRCGGIENSSPIIYLSRF